MIALLAPLLGLIVALLPKLVDIWYRKVELQHEIELTKVQMDAAREGVNLRIQLAEATATVGEGESLREHDSDLDGGPFWNGVRASIRPTITYIFFGMFVAIKCAAAWVMLSSGSDIPTTLKSIWDQDTFAIFGAIMGFWFGSRTIEKFKQGAAGDGVTAGLPGGSIVKLQRTAPTEIDGNTQITNQTGRTVTIPPPAVAK